MNCALGRKAWAPTPDGASLHTNQKTASTSPGLSCLITRENLILALKRNLQVCCRLPIQKFGAMNCALARKAWAPTPTGASLHTNQKPASTSRGLSCLITWENLILALERNLQAM